MKAAQKRIEPDPKGRRAAVTGAGAGIGSAIALPVSAAGAAVFGGLDIEVNNAGIVRPASLEQVTLVPLMRLGTVQKR